MSEQELRIWVDADACPRPIKEILYRASARHAIPLVLVANVPLRAPASELISTLIVPPGPDIADAEIVKQVRRGDLVVSADHMLAYLAVRQGAVCIDPRGTLYTRDKVHEKVNLRSLMEAIHNDDTRITGPRPFSQKDRQAFANQLEKWIREAHS